MFRFSTPGSSEKLNLDVYPWSCGSPLVLPRAIALGYTCFSEIGAGGICLLSEGQPVTEGRLHIFEEKARVHCEGGHN